MQRHSSSSQNCHQILQRAQRHRIPKNKYCFIVEARVPRMASAFIKHNHRRQYIEQNVRRKLKDLVDPLQPHPRPWHFIICLVPGPREAISCLVSCGHRSDPLLRMETSKGQKGNEHPMSCARGQRKFRRLWSFSLSSGI